MHIVLIYSGICRNKAVVIW